MLANLPAELLVKILDNLDSFALTSCRFVNRSFDDVIKSSSLLQYKLELGLAGVDANPACTLAPSECLEAVRSYRRGWENLAWSSSDGWREATGSVSHNRGTFTLGEVVAKGDDDHYYYKLRTQRLQLKSRHRRLEERTWSEDRPINIIPVGIDPSQDLLFAIPNANCGEVRILILSTFEPHPGVAHPTISLPVGQESSVEMDVYKSNVAAATHLRFTFKFEGSILVYNWRTGAMLVEISYPCDDFFFLTEDLVACYVTWRDPTDRPSHFAVFRIPDTRNVAPSQEPSPTTTPLCVFDLPHSIDGKSWYLAWQGRMNSSYGSCPPPNDPAVPFYASGRRLLFTLWSLPYSSFWGSPECSLIIPLRTLLNHAPSEPTPSTTVFHWDTWGPSGTRLLSGIDARQMSLQFGWKIARLGPPDPSNMPLWPSRDVGITVYDFNPLPFHGPPDVTEREEWEPETDAVGRTKRVVTSPSSCPDSAELAGVQTYLPYRITSAPFELRGRAADHDNYEISLGEDGMIVWTHLTLDYAVLTI